MDNDQQFYGQRATEIQDAVNQGDIEHAADAINRQI